MEQAYINGHVTGTIAWVDMIWVPPGERKNGKGRGLYLDWESKLPPETTLVRLMAADTGSGNSDPFWERLGFNWVYLGSDDLRYEDLHMMWKGVNGTPTPASIDPDSD